jgi:hypothetical protein
MAPTSLTIPLITLAPGTREFGPVSVDDAVVRATITIDRTVANGLNSQPATTHVEIGVWQSDDGGNSWQFRASAGLNGGTYPKNTAGDPYTESNVQVDLNPTTGRRVKAVVEVAGASVAIAGSLAIQ